MGAIEDIAAERRRQIEKEGWTAEHDDEHANGELAAAAACYAYGASLGPKTAKHLGDTHAGFFSVLRMLWPRSWEWYWWKPKTSRRDLVRAGALIVAEIERLDRAAK